MNEPILPPQDLEAEQAALGSALVEPKAGLIVARMLRESDFYREVHQQIFAAIQAVVDRRDPVDLITVSAELRRRDRLERVGGAEYLDALIGTVPTAAHVGRYAQLIAEKALLRDLVHTGSSIMQAGYDNPSDVRAALDGAMAQMVKLRRGSGIAAGAVPAARDMDGFTDWLYALRESPRCVSGFRWDLPNLDRALGGHAEDDLVLLKAGTGYGKSTTLRQGALATARHYHRQGEPEAVLVYLLEGARRRWYQGALAYLGQINKRTMGRGSAGVVTNQGEIDLGRAVAELYNLGQHNLLVGSDCRSAADVVSDVREKLVDGIKPCAVCVDYLQLLDAPGSSLREKTVAAMKVFIELRADVDFPWILTSQVTVQQNGQVRAREAEDVEMGASTILWLDRGMDKSNPDEKRVSPVGRMVTTKVRDGACATEVLLDMSAQWLDRATIREQQRGRGEAEGPRQDH